MDATNLFLTVMLSAGLGQAPAVPPTQAAPRVRVADVVVQGSEAVSTPTVLSYLRTRPGGELNNDTLQDDVRALITSRQFADVRAQVQDRPDGSVTVVIVLRDLPAIKRVEFRGAKHMSEEELQSVTGLRVGATFSPSRNRLACQTIMRKYNDMGRPFAECYLVKGGKPDDTEVVFNITEGPKVKVSDIEFTGHTFVSAAVLATHIQSSKKVLGLSGEYNRELIDADIASLLEYYRSFGFLDAAVSCEIRHQPDGYNAVLVFHIKEGVRYRLKDVPTVTGSKRVPSKSDLALVIKLKAGDWYDARELKRGADEIHNWYGYQGFDARVTPVPYFLKDEPGVVTVHFDVDQANK
jgi:outer membrane protein insertion porin family